MRSPRLTGVGEQEGVAAGSVATEDGWDVYHAEPTLPTAPVVRVPVPARFSAMLQAAPDLAIAWRMQTRSQFEALFDAGYQAVDFRRDGDRGHYILVR
jgi:predicted GNAT superfamily acetyltransferase